MGTEDRGSLRTVTHLKTAAAPTNTKTPFAKKTKLLNLIQDAFKKKNTLFYTSLLTLWSHAQTQPSYRTTPRRYLPCNYRQGHDTAF